MDGDRFSALWQRNLSSVSGADSEAVFKLLSNNYRDPIRYYHDGQHINDCLGWLDRYRDQVGDPDAVELAIWFHDVVYEPGAKDNEQLSADQFMAKTDGVFDDTLRDTVYLHIMATVHDGAEIVHADTKYMLDIDLSGFGRPWAEFIQDSDNLRLELKDWPDDVFYQRQAVFQDKLFGQPRFFKSDYFYDNYEAQARKNRNDYFETIKVKMQAGG